MTRQELKAARRAADELWALHKSYGRITVQPIHSMESWAAKWIKSLNIDQYADYPKRTNKTF